MLELTLQDVDPEFIYLSEPISDNTGPLISPATVEEFMLPVYEKIVAVAHSHSCHNVLVSTYGNSARLFPSMIAAGVNTLWISEAPDILDLDYRTLRRRFGPRLGLIGGIPLSILREGSLERIEQRLSKIVPPLLREGRYIPLAAGRVREGVSWTAYRRYREVLGRMMG
jgi:uroporphyrinogen-III decarboxylase